MPTGRSAPAAAVVDGILYVIGGISTPSFDAVGTVEAYDPVTNTWTTKTPMPTPRSLLAAAVLEGVIYVAGGTDGTNVLATVEAYDPATDRWTTKALLPTARWGSAVGVVGGLVYIIGGAESLDPFESRPIATVESYNPATDMWTAVTPMPTARYDLAVTVVENTLYAMGGTADFTGPYFDVIEAYTP